MKRIYLDWNVISNLKQDHFRELRKSLSSVKDEVMIFYTSAHFDDVMKSNQPGNPYFKQDLSTIKEFCGDHLLDWVYGEGIRPYKIDPVQYMDFHVDKLSTGDLMNMDNIVEELNAASEDLGVKNLGDQYKLTHQLKPIDFEITDENRDAIKMMFPNIDTNSSSWDFMQDVQRMIGQLMGNKDFYKQLRSYWNNSGFKLDINAGNWPSQEVFKNIESFLTTISPNLSFNDLLGDAMKNDPYFDNYYTYFTSQYNMLDFIGYKADKLPKDSDTFQNIATDGEHAFFASYCDLFVVGDKKLASKARAVYHNIGVSTQVLSPQDFNANFDEILNSIGKSNFDILENLTDVFTDENLIKYTPTTQDSKYETFVYSLPFKYLDYFTHVTYFKYHSSGAIELVFHFGLRPQNKFIFYKELDHLFDQIVNRYGLDVENKDELKNDFIQHKDHFHGIQWLSGKSNMILRYEQGDNLPDISFLWEPGEDSE